MKRTLLAVAVLLAAAPIARGQSRVISCPGVTGQSPCDGFSLSGGGSVSNSVFTTAADEHGLGLHSSVDFTFQSAIFQSLVGIDNDVVVLGYRRSVVDVPFSGFPYPGSYGPFSYFAEFHINPGSPTLVSFNGWDDLAALKFDGAGGYLLGDPTRFRGAFDYTIRAVTIVTPTPEPSVVLLLATGLVGVFGAVNRKRSRAAAAY